MGHDSLKPKPSALASLGRHRRIIVVMAVVLALTFMGFLVLLGVLLYRIAVASGSDVAALAFHPLSSVLVLVT